MSFLFPPHHNVPSTTKCMRHCPLHHACLEHTSGASNAECSVAPLSLVKSTYKKFITTGRFESHLPFPPFILIPEISSVCHQSFHYLFHIIFYAFTPQIIDNIWMYKKNTTIICYSVYSYMLKKCHEDV